MQDNSRENIHYNQYIKANLLFAIVLFVIHVFYQFQYLVIILNCLQSNTVGDLVITMVHDRYDFDLF